MNARLWRMFRHGTVLMACAVVSAMATEEAALEENNAVAVRLNASVVSLREIEFAFSDSYSLIQDRIRRGELKPETRVPALKEAWKQATQSVIQDRLLDEQGSRFRKEIKAQIVSQHSPGTPSTRMEEAYRRWEADMVAQIRRDLLQEAGGELALRATLEKRGQTMKQWEQNLVLEIFRREVLFRNVGPVSDSPAAARAYYDAHPEDFSRPEAWRLRRIRIPKDRFTTAEEAAKTAELIHTKLSEGVEFAKVASALKYDPGVDEKGGLLTVDGKTDLPGGHFPAEEKIAVGLKDGAFSKPIDTGDAYLIVKREGYRPALTMPWEDAAGRASALSMTERIKKKKEQFYNKQKSEAFIEMLITEPPARWLK